MRCINNIKVTLPYTAFICANVSEALKGRACRVDNKAHANSPVPATSSFERTKYPLLGTVTRDCLLWMSLSYIVISVHLILTAYFVTGNLVVVFFTEKELDWKTLDLNKLKVKDLRKILGDWGEECKGCTEKSEFTKRVQELRPKYVKEEL